MLIQNWIWLFFCYSFLGWILETTVAAVQFHRYIDRSVVFGPLCVIYGIAGMVITAGLQDLSETIAFLFLGSSIYATVIEWVAGHLLERISHTRWWDYSGRRWNLDGYICFSASLFWGLLGVIGVKWGNPLLLWLYHMIPDPVSKLVLGVLITAFVLDVIGTALTLAGTVHKLPQLEKVGNRITALTLRLGQWILEKTERRIQRNYPEAQFVFTTRKEKSQVFAKGCSFYKVVLLFVIGAFLGDITEVIFCKLTADVWMSRSSVVWGPFSIVWGLAMALVTVLLYRYRERSILFLFFVGTFLGGAYEYLCSVFTEMVFGTIFWDYSGIPLNLGGRINLLYCSFWGIAAVIWFRCIYPYISRWIEKIPVRLGTVLTWGLIVFMTCNTAVSCLALSRYRSRTAGEPAGTAWEEYIDDHYGDERMQQIYPNAIQTDVDGDLKFDR